LHRKTYDPKKLQFESLLANASLPMLTHAFSYAPPVPLSSSAARARREYEVAVALRPIARSFDLDVIVPDASAPAGALWSEAVEGPNLVDMLNAGEVATDVLPALTRLGRLHAHLARRWHSLGDGSWANIIVTRTAHDARLTLCDFEHASWPAHAPFDTEGALVPPPDSSSAHWAPDDIYESLVTTACKLVPRRDLGVFAAAYATGLAEESRVVAYAVARLFALRKAVAWLRVGSTRWLDKRGATYMQQLSENYDVIASALADAIDLPVALRTVSARPRAWAQRTLGWLTGREYSWDATAYHDYSRTFEDRDGVAARALLALPVLHDGAARDVLDVGAGTGLIGGTAAICHPAWRVTLLDLSREQLAQAEHGYGSRARYVCAPMERLALADGSFDLILMASVIRYSAEPERAVAEMHRVLRPLGHVVVLPTDFSGANDLLYKKLGLRSAESVEQFFCARGFRSIGPSWKVHVRRGFAGRPLVFVRR